MRHGAPPARRVEVQCIVLRLRALPSAQDDSTYATVLGKFGELTRSFENFGEHLCGEFAGIGVLH